MGKGSDVAVFQRTSVEQFLLGNTTLEPGEYRWLWAPINLALLGDDLEFRFGEPGTALELAARVEYTDEVWGLPGDFNNDGIVDAADYTVWCDYLGWPTNPDLNNNGDGTKVIDARDFALWRAQYGRNRRGYCPGGQRGNHSRTRHLVHGDMCG